MCDKYLFFYLKILKTTGLNGGYYTGLQAQAQAAHSTTPHESAPHVGGSGGNIPPPVVPPPVSATPPVSTVPQSQVGLQLGLVSKSVSISSSNNISSTLTK